MARMKFTREVLQDLAPGNIIESGPLMPGLSMEPVVWEVEKVSSKGAVTFRVTYFGVFLTKAVCVYREKPVWVFDKQPKGGLSGEVKSPLLADWLVDNPDTMYHLTDLLALPLKIFDDKIAGAQKMDWWEDSMGTKVTLPIRVLDYCADVAGDYFSGLVSVVGDLCLLVTIETRNLEATLYILAGAPELKRVDGLDYELGIEKLLGSSVRAKFRAEHGQTKWAPLN